MTVAGWMAGAGLVLGGAAYRLAREAARAGVAPGGLRGRVEEGHARRLLGDDTREYVLRVSLRNGLATPVVVSACQLRVTYLTRANFLGVVDLAPTADALPAVAAADRLAFPLRLHAGAIAEGRLFFRTSNVIPRHCRIDDYTLVLACDDGRRVKVDAALPAMLAADSDGTGPATWGWD